MLGSKIFMNAVHVNEVKLQNFQSFPRNGDINIEFN